MIFISYSLKDEAAHSSLCLALESANLPYWPGQLKAGSLKDQLREAISKCDVCIFVATKNSVTSQWCLNEIGAFWGAGKKIIIYAAHHDIEKDLPPLFQGDYWTGNAREVINQAREELSEVAKLKTQNRKGASAGAKTKRGPNISCSYARPTVLVTVNWTFYDLKEHENLKDYAYSAAVVEFENKPAPGRKVESLDEVEAQIVFYNTKGEERQFVESGMWVGTDAKSIAFEVGRRKRLVIAVGKHNEQALEVWAVQANDFPGFNVKPVFFKLSDKWLRVYVRLISRGEIVKESQFELEVISSAGHLDWLTVKKFAS